MFLQRSGEATGKALFHFNYSNDDDDVDDDDTKMNDYLLLHDVSIFPIDKIYTYKMCVCNILCSRDNPSLKISTTTLNIIYSTLSNQV